ncbi:phage head-tail joining protein [Nitrospirillum viridazoti]|uniref:Uncharacterized protein n=1 Tax=Nitrospirillum viridazoti CBAmc TaxID=1441467 RepID=A0A248JRN4_9PROT|nr:hypothetical protein [Nitrospirillum amazonense]ASG21402.1 hypothetical protein Y958_11610 [Nitrospirillum amazonense CBAmc]TWB33080.1 hypothetical protein FBZ91_115142 [Nitrospirillum amazonense]
MAFTKADLDALKAARAQGVLRVRFEGREVIYRSDAEMKALQREMEAEVNPRPRFKTALVLSRRGW